MNEGLALHRDDAAVKQKRACRTARNDNGGVLQDNTGRHAYLTTSVNQTARSDRRVYGFQVAGKYDGTDTSYPTMAPN